MGAYDIPMRVPCVHASRCNKFLYYIFTLQFVLHCVFTMQVVFTLRFNVVF